MPPREETERLCALTRETRPLADLVRFVVSPDGVLVPDIDARAEGRGVWISLGEKQVAEAVRRKAFHKSLKTEVTLPDDLPGLTRQRLTERYLNALQMARKAGQLLTGMTKVKSAIEGAVVVGLLTASDAAPDGRSKLLQALHARQAYDREAGREAADVPHFELLDSTQMGLALGQENVIHAALTKGAAAQSALARALRLARYIAQ